MVAGGGGATAAGAGGVAVVVAVAAVVAMVAGAVATMATGAVVAAMVAADVVGTDAVAAAVAGAATSPCQASVIKRQPHQERCLEMGRGEPFPFLLGRIQLLPIDARSPSRRRHEQMALDHEERSKFVM